MRKVILAWILFSFGSGAALAQEVDTRAEIRELREKLERLEKKLADDDAAREKRLTEDRMSCLVTHSFRARSRLS